MELENWLGWSLQHESIGTQSEQLDDVRDHATTRNTPFSMYLSSFYTNFIVQLPVLYVSVSSQWLLLTEQLVVAISGKARALGLRTMI